MATFSTGERKRRPRGDKKSIEMSQHLKQTFEAALLTHLYPRSQIDIYVEVWRFLDFFPLVFKRISMHQVESHLSKSQLSKNLA